MTTTAQMIRVGCYHYLRSYRIVPVGRPKHQHPTFQMALKVYEENLWSDLKRQSSGARAWGYHLLAAVIELYPSCPLTRYYRQSA